MRTGFTLIEVILTVTILAILAVTALPDFFDVSESAERNTVKGIVTAVESGIQMYGIKQVVDGAEDFVYPTDLDPLDGGITCSATNPCFSNVLQNGVTDGRWSKISSSEYYYTSRNGDKDRGYSYSNTTGAFICANGMGCLE